MKTIRRLKFTNEHGQTLAARLDVPVDGHIKGMALFAHCFTCSKNLNAVRQVATGLNRQGIAVFSFDFTGLGQSQGAFEETNFSSNIDDLVAAADFVAEAYMAPELIIGHSLGGAAAIAASVRIESVKAVATIGAPFEPSHVTKMFKEAQPEIDARGYGTVELGGRPFQITTQFIEDLQASDLSTTLSKLKRALLVMHAPMDNTVSIENATDIFMAAKHPKSFVSLDRADHLLSKSEDAIYTGEVIGQWVSKYLEVAHVHDDLDDNAQVVARTGKEKFHTDIRVGDHGMIADEPESYGGQNHGPTPYDLLLAGLGACTSMTLRMYADRKKWPLEAIVVRLDHQKRHTTDCETCDEDGAKLDHIDKRIELIGDLDAKQRKRLMEIAERCPVNRTLHSEIIINSIEEPPNQ